MKRHTILFFYFFLFCNFLVLSQNGIQIIPNPFERDVVVSISASYGDSLSGTWYDIQGKEMFLLPPMLILHDDTLIFEKTLQNGVYLLSIKKNAAQQGHKILRSNGGESAQITFIINMDEAVEGNTDMQIFPNPSRDGLFTIRYGDKEKEVLLEVFDSSGRLLRQKKIRKSFGFEKKIDLSAEALGIYYLKMTSGEKEMLEKLSLIE